MNEFEQIASGLMMPIKKGVPEDNRKVLDEVENKLAEKLQEQYEKGQQDLAKAWQRKHLGGA